MPKGDGKTNAQRRAERRDTNRERLNGYKLARGCSRCGYNRHPAALEFHHLEPTTKVTEVTRLVWCTWERVMKEVRLCELLCANCHREETYG